MKIIPLLGLTEEHRSNLQKLVDKLLSLPKNYKNFDMTGFNDELYFIEEGNFYDCPLYLEQYQKAQENNYCGAVGCAVGHAVYIKEAKFKKSIDEDWIEYSFRLFGLDRYGEDNNNCWIWCFSGDWSHNDNTPEGAAKRIQWMLEHNGVPNNYRKQINGDKPLCYRK